MTRLSDHQAGWPLRATRAVGWLSAVAALGTALLAVGHTGRRLPVLSALGPAGTTAVWPAAAGFAVAALVYAVLATGAFRRRAWAWPLGTAVNALALVSGLLQFRGVASLLGLAVSAAILALLLSPAGRRGLLPRP